MQTTTKSLDIDCNSIGPSKFRILHPAFDISVPSTTMATLFLRRPFLPTILATSIVATPLLLRPQSFLRPLHCDAGPASPSPAYSYTRDAQTPVLTSSSSQRRLNPAAFRQISLGSILGLCSGLAVSIFSRPLAVLIGLLLTGAYALESRGIKVIPYKWLGRVVHNRTPEDMRGAVLDNLAFKFSFGAAFLLAGFGSLES